MAGSSIRNSVHRRNHKERAQPLGRARLGLLEKKKDYILRARDYKSKKERLRRLREKASFRNKDEFYWGMIKSKTQGGVHVKERETSKSLAVDEVKLLKSQDAGYVRLAIAKDESRITALKTQLQVLTSLFPSKHSDSRLDDMSDDEDQDEDMMQDIDEDTLIEAGIIAPAKRSQGKQPALNEFQAARGHTVFTDDQDELLTYDGPTQSVAKSITPSKNASAAASTPVDLGWITTNRKPPQTKTIKSSAPVSARETRSAIVSDDEDDQDDEIDLGDMEDTEVDVARSKQRHAEKQLQREAFQHRHLLLLELQQRLSRLSQLRAVLTQINLQKQLMNKHGSAIKKKNAERIVLPSLRKGRAAREGKRDDVADDGEDDEAGSRVVHSGKVFKWKAERKR